MMINVKKLLENLQDTYPKPLMEHSFVDLDSHVDPARKSRASGLGAFYQSVNETPDGHTSTHWQVQSASDANLKYNAVVEIVVPSQGGLFALVNKWEPKKFKAILTQSDVRVHCSCPDFYWAGMMHNVGPNGKYKGSLAQGNPTIVKNAQSAPSAPVIRDPSGSNTMCKHLHAIFKVFPSNAFQILSAVRKFDNKNKVDVEKTEKVDSGETPIDQIKEPTQPEKGKPREIPTSESRPILDSLYTAGEQLNKDIESGASDILNDTNDAVETEIITEPELQKTEPITNIIQDDTIEENPVEPESVSVNDIVNTNTPVTKPTESNISKILASPDEDKLNKNVKNVSVEKIMNPETK